MTRIDRSGAPRRALAWLLAGMTAAASVAAPAAAAPTEPFAPPPLQAVAAGAVALDDRDTMITAGQVEAVRRGLDWLARNQASDGSWSAKIGFKLNTGYEYTSERGHVGVTSLALMAFLAGGHMPGRGEYGEVVLRGLDWILAACQPDGYISAGGTRMYSHAFATLLLAEIYGMTTRRDVHTKLQNAVDFIVNAQNAQGGWRYAPFAQDSDMSIVVCQVLALRAARNIGIQVPAATVERATNYVFESAITERDQLHGGFNRRWGGDPVGAFTYQRGTGSRSSFPLTAAGVTSLHGLGIYSDDAIRLGLDYLRRNIDDFNRRYGPGGHYFFWYGHYYAVQAMYTAGTQSGVRYWEPYFERLRQDVLGLQLPDGSFPNHVGPGPAFGTAMAVLILQIPYRYLPIFQR